MQTSSDRAPLYELTIRSARTAILLRTYSTIVSIRKIWTRVEYEGKLTLVRIDHHYNDGQSRRRLVYPMKN
jgi:hypothetical protein